jgi:predicted house-cleaning NTP pyrophosphatase (Maf/HAM1 superfamily)
MTTHTIYRTSPKGEKFVGACSLCGKQGLTFKSLSEECENVRGLSIGEALLEAVDGLNEVRNGEHQ